MSHATAAQSRRTWKERVLCLILTAVMLLGLAPGLTLPASAHWADEYLDMLVDWGVMRADQIGDPDGSITRAEFMAIINRAYGYTEKKAIPFTDVLPTDWFYDDVAIAYTAGYMAGTSRTTASPNDTLTREMAVCVLGRNMMLKETAGESLAFADSRDVSTWASGLVKTAVDNYIVSGYPDNTFGPQDPLTKSQMAVLITQCIGTPLQSTGEYSLGGVFGNVTITSSDVTLRDTTISGDLYVSGGVGLGGVKLENVNVLGRIIVSGTGESEKGEASVVMRNVSANEMLVDNMRKNEVTVTVRAEGLTEIGETLVRTKAYLEDNTPAENGLRLITLEADAGTKLDLAGRIKEVVDKTPNSTILLAKGNLETLTVDESATNSTVEIDRNTEVKELNLDVGTTVNGQGDVANLNVNAAGSTVTMLPDDIYVRPGLSASIAGENMDSAAAEESSLDPRILSGYPVASNVAPTSLQADFAGNKRGTVYWAVSNITDGSITADDLVNPPAYASLAVKNGSVELPSADTVVPVQITGLTTGGSYYLSAVLVDSRGARSPVKVISFTTPDNSKPAFSSGYPYMSLITDTLAQATVMATKSCKLYYAVLPQGAAAPTTNELRSASVAGNLGYGVIDVVKNTEHTFTASRLLEEQKTYVLYLWLCDADGVNSSAIQRLQFTTVDKTPPEFVVDPYVNQIAATSVRLVGTLNENGTVYWALVEHGTAYPKPQPGSGETTAPLDSEYAKLQVSAGMNCLKSGSVSVRGDTEFTLNLTGLTAEKTYDLYYLAKDTAGNYSLEVKTLEIHTQDNSGPIVKQSFTDYTGLDNTQNPLPSTDIVLEFSEDIACTEDGFGGLSFLALAEGKRPADAVAWPGDANLGSGITSTISNPAELLAFALSKSIILYQIRDGRETAVTVRDATNETDENLSWTIDYRNVKVTPGEGGKILVTFPTNSADLSQSALNLASGATYFFRFENIIDTAQEQNRITPHPLWYGAVGADLHQVPAFTTVFAQVNLTSPGVGTDGPFQRDSNGEQTTVADYVDLSFRMDPDATAKVQDDNFYDVLLYSDTVTRYNLYYRVLDATTKKVVENPDPEYLLPSKNETSDDNGWFYLGDSGDVNPAPDWSGRSVNGYFNGCNAANFPRVNQLSEEYTYEFAISLTRYGTSSVRETWNGQINFEVHVVAGVSNPLYRLSINPSKDALAEFLESGLENGGGVSIGINRTQNYLPLRGSFIDSQLPQFSTGYPQFEPGDSFVNIKLNLSRDGTIYYVIAERNQLTPTLTNNPSYTPDEIWNAVSESTPEAPFTGTTPSVTRPVNGDIFNPAPYRGSAICGNVAYPGGYFTLDHLLNAANSQNLKPTTDYYAYFVLKGVSDELSQVYVYKFTTTETSKPKITLSNGIGGIVGAVTQVPSNMNYAIFTTTELNMIPMLAANERQDQQNLLSKYVADSSSLPTAYENYTVVQAMKEHYNASIGDFGPEFNDYSVFDMYATDLAKSQVANVIRNSGVGTALVRGHTTTPGTDVTTDINHVKDMTPGTYYWCLAVAYNTSSSQGIGDSFSSIDNVLIPDTVAPNLKEDDGLSFVVTSDIDKQSPESWHTFSGRINLQFDKPVYWSRSGDGTGSSLPVLNSNAQPPVSDSATTIGILQDLGGTATAVTGGISVSNPSSSQTAQSNFTLTFNGLSIGDTITLFNEGYIANQSGYSATRKLQLKLTWGVPPSDSGMKIETAYFVATWINP